MPESRIIPVANTQKENRIGDLIFVHGLDGDGTKYWTKDNEPTNFWPRWVGDDIENVGVWSISFPASAFAWQGAAMPLSQRVSNIINLLQIHDLGTKRPVVFITHSLGGLLVKQMLHSAMDGTVADAKWLVEHTKGIVFIATPHSGSNLANFVDNLSFLLPTDRNFSKSQGSLAAKT